MNKPQRHEHIDAVVDRVHGMLNGPDGDGQLMGTYETQRVTFEIPKAFAYLATYLASDARDGSALCQDIEAGRIALDSEQVRAIYERFFEQRLHHMMHQDLHLLAGHAHPVR